MLFLYVVLLPCLGLQPKENQKNVQQAAGHSYFFPHDFSLSNCDDIPLGTACPNKMAFMCAAVDLIASKAHETRRLQER